MKMSEYYQQRADEQMSLEDFVQETVEYIEDQIAAEESYKEWYWT